MRDVIMLCCSIYWFKRILNLLVYLIFSCGCVYVLNLWWSCVIQGQIDNVANEVIEDAIE